MSLAALVTRHRRAQLVAARRTAQHVEAAWSRLDSSNLSGSWTATTGPAAVEAISRGQFVAATIAQPYVTAALEAQGGDGASAGEISAQAFAGVASDGRELAGLMYLPVIGAKMQIAAGRPMAAAIDASRGVAVSYAVTQVLDAGRAAIGAANVAARGAAGWIRALTPPSCPRCAILDGRWYRWNAAFARHTSCDCTQVPGASRGTVSHMLTDPGQMVRNGQITGLTAADTQAVLDGADLGQVVNAHRGMYTASGRKFTREGTTTGAFRAAGGRLTPEQIYHEAGDDRGAAIRELARNGYLL